MQAAVQSQQSPSAPQPFRAVTASPDAAAELLAAVPGRPSAQTKSSVVAGGQMVKGPQGAGKGAGLRQGPRNRGAKREASRGKSDGGGGGGGDDQFWRSPMPSDRPAGGEFPGWH
jgi:hypothetical protein